MNTVDQPKPSVKTPHVGNEYKTTLFLPDFKKLSWKSFGILFASAY